MGTTKSRLLQSFLLALCFSSLGNAFVVASGEKATCARREGTWPSSLPEIKSVPRCGSVSVKSTAAPIEQQNPFAKLERKRRLATGMAFLTGVADLTLFLKYKTFATMMTGNTMWMAVALIEKRFIDVGYYASVIMSYTVGLTVFRKTNLSFKDKTLRICSFLVASLFVGSDLLFKAYQSRWIPMMMLASGFGIINSVGQEFTGTLTFVITGHLTRLTNQIVDRLSSTAGRKKLSLADKQSMIQNAFVYTGFFCGALLAGFLKAKGILMERIGVFSSIGIAYASLWVWKDTFLRKDEKLNNGEDVGKAWQKKINGKTVTNGEQVKV